jgi:hypothetical protein
LEDASGGPAFDGGEQNITVGGDAS